jgi:hypothetical protein
MSNNLDPIPYLRRGTYRHYKGGLYRITYMARHSESLEPMVVYQSEATWELWVRPHSMFVESVEFEGELVTRFKLVAAEECFFMPRHHPMGGSL